MHSVQPVLIAPQRLLMILNTKTYSEGQSCINALQCSPAVQVPPLPSYRELASAEFTWGEVDSKCAVQLLNVIYSEIVHWRRNVFNVPSGKAGKGFVTELARLIRAYAETSSLEAIALKAVMVMPALLLQKPSRTSRAKDHSTHLARCLQLFEER